MSGSVNEAAEACAPHPKTVYSAGIRIYPPEVLHHDPIIDGETPSASVD